MAVGFGAGRVFRGDVAARADLVFDQHKAAGFLAQLLAEVTHHNVRAASRRERADDVNVLRRIFLR